MASKNKKIIRAVQKNLGIIQEQLRFKTSHISDGGKISLAGVSISLVSLFIIWVNSEVSIVSSGNTQISGVNSFSALVGYTGFFILLILGFICFSIFSIRKKEKFHSFSLIHIYDFAACFYGSILIMILCLQGLFYMRGLQTFSSDIGYGKGIILCITGAIVILIGSLILKKEYRKNIKGSYTSEIKNQDYGSELEPNRDNMKLPF
ncbi:hypothetical protein GW846_05145 [Candidatus Gracilibacteria bacterium]|nr:hypothetical protein [Candidatus Gracilibacteria bacterium]